MPKSPKEAKKKYSIASTAIFSSTAVSTDISKEATQSTWLPPPQALGEKVF